MTAKAIAAMLHGRKFGKGYMCRCPCPIHANGDRNRSLSVRELNGWVRFKCFTGCSRDEILAAMGLQVKDLALNELRKNPEWEQQRRDGDRLSKQEHRYGLAIMAQVVLPMESNYWCAVEKNLDAEIRQLRDKIYPEEKKRLDRAAETQRILTEYSFDELWECLP